MYHHSRHRIITGAKQPRNDATCTKTTPAPPGAAAAPRLRLPKIAMPVVRFESLRFTRSRRDSVSLPYLFPTRGTTGYAVNVEPNLSRVRRALGRSPRLAPPKFCPCQRRQREAPFHISAQALETRDVCAPIRWESGFPSFAETHTLKSAPTKSAPMLQSACPEIRTNKSKTRAARRARDYTNT